MRQRSRSNPPKLDFQFQRRPGHVKELSDPHIPELDFMKQSGREWKIRKTDDVDFYPQKVPMFLSQYHRPQTHLISDTPRDRGSMFSRLSDSANLSELDSARSFAILRDPKYRIPDLSRNSCSDSTRHAVEHPPPRLVHYVYEKYSRFDDSARPEDVVQRQKFKFGAQTSRAQAQFACKGAWAHRQCGADRFYDVNYAAVEPQGSKGFRFPKQKRKSITQQ